MEAKKSIAGGLVVSLVGVNVGMCEIANATRLCEEDVCKPEYHIHGTSPAQNFGSGGVGTLVIATVTSTATSTADILSFNSRR
jgi:hypothetical protein